jgi:molybdopterin-biosynthesis enzyme MoeA-like protein
MVVEQLLFFQESKEEKLAREVQRLKEQADKVRKGLYAKHGELMKLYLEQKHELEVLKQALCRSKVSTL